jgi:hypothetical protein
VCSLLWYLKRKKFPIHIMFYDYSHLHNSEMFLLLEFQILTTTYEMFTRRHALINELNNCRDQSHFKKLIVA